jgi:acyl CoA:acetate/3-ketoacid CoA transferase alpha subunit
MVLKSKVQESTDAAVSVIGDGAAVMIGEFMAGSIPLFFHHHNYGYGG